MAITYEETVQTALNLVREIELLKAQLQQRDARIRELEQAEVAPKK